MKTYHSHQSEVRCDCASLFTTVVALLLLTASTAAESIAFFFVWTALLIVWLLIGLPLGPGAAMTLPVNA